jgi:anti-sigma regulatory factor (Ser/Thr protein kinase)
MAQLRNALRAFSLDRMKPSSTLARLNRLAEEVLETAFATLVYAVVDPETLVCRYTSAGHPPPLALFPDGRVELLEGGRGLPLGTGANARYRQDVVELPAGTVLVLYTDGLVERRGESIDAGFEELRAAALGGPRDPEQLVEHILESMIGSREREDDIAIIAVRVFAVAPHVLDLRLPNATGSLDVVRDALRVWLGGAPTRRAEAEEIVLAAWEACANAIEHAQDPGTDLVRLTATLVDSRVRVLVEDSGRWSPQEDRPGRGLGLQLMRTLMSSVEIDTDDDGTRVTLERALDAAAG